ncbi:unnamed protein product [Adineta steineri]|uniref:NAD(P)(+)--arginine ADP-ribosyltransferase n=1 Tax=Adineta steineri TaxID=433720 RepID=A0A813PJZ4_9BILA|nr:unnamed protein product [Adineta steineri]CAF1492406.1 unnamed protein product [Adineta steineri]CAF3832901.1 unnamed protein product [Adineta steineri]CAF4065370.1 unnamed protein product [Adineta steineri]
MATDKSSGTKKTHPATSLSMGATTNRRMNLQRMQNVLLIWLDNNINDNNADCSNTIKQLKRVVNNVNTFTGGEQCVQFIQTITNNKVCMIVSGSLGKSIVPHVHHMSQVDTIFVFCSNREWHKQWAKEWHKIKGVFTDITSICEALNQAARECEQNAVSISFVASNKRLDQLNPSFMYTQILKEIILTINFEDKHFKEFIAYCRDVYIDDENELKNVNQLETTYKKNIPIWWYTWDAFLYRMLNQALRLMDADIIIRMGFFINDLHRDIQRLHSKQFDGQESGKIFTVYRGQGLSKEDFIEMTKTKGGLLSFNNFLSTSKSRGVSLSFIQKAATNPELIGVLFVMSINSAHSTTPFASLTDVSYFQTEDEVLFSMHTIFRIEDIKAMDGNNNLYQVNLTLTSDNDQDLRTLTDQIRQEISPASIGLYRLGQLLRKMGQPDKAQEVFEVLLHQATHESNKTLIYQQLGVIKYDQGGYKEALSYYEKSLAIYQETLSSNHPDPELAQYYNNIGAVYDSMGDYQKALSYYEKALAIRQESLPSNHSDLGVSYNNIGIVYARTGDYPKALSYFEKAVAIQQESLPFNHPDLACSYANIGAVYDSMGDYPKALSYYEKALAIRQQALPSNHSELGTSYNNIGLVYHSMGDHPKALSSHEKALAIRQQSLSSSHPDLAWSYNNIGAVYDSMGDYPKALSYYEKALAIRQQSLPSNHPDLALIYDNIGSLYENIGNYSKAHSFYERAVQNAQQSLPTNHPDLQKWSKHLENIKKKL